MNRTPSSEILRRIERYRPTDQPYHSPRELLGKNLAVYGKELCEYLARRGQMTVHESYYIHYLQTCLSYEGHQEVSQKLRDVAWSCRVVDAMRGTNVSITTLALGDQDIIKASWRFLPDPESMSPQDLLAALRDHLTEQTSHTSFQFDLERIEFALSLKDRLKIAIGTDEFYGYYAFLFPKDVILFECPVHGNAAFVTRGDWKVLSQLYKSQLEGHARRIIHRHFWRSDITTALARYD